jgi:LysR family transcriptional regulator for bpeEF and oprC|tara:strand:+ start:1845 stop:2756 length:912 start_codon:yes stop_codon:yes gene_type:complete
VDRFVAMQLFIRIVDSGSFTDAAQEMNISRASATTILKKLEDSLGVRLLSRTTRSVSPTHDGRFYYEQSLEILRQLNETEDILSEVAATQRGSLRIDMPNSFARLEVIPKLPEFCELYPDINLILSAGDRVINLVKESVDCVIRIGELADLSAVSRALNSLPQVTCVSPAYIDKYGIPLSPEALSNHFCVEYRTTTTFGVDPMVFNVNVDMHKEMYKVKCPAILSVNNGDSYVSASKAGLGIIQIPEYHIRQELQKGTLIEILSEYRPDPLPLSVIYSHHSHMKPALRAFIDWMVAHFGSHSC